MRGIIVGPIALHEGRRHFTHYFEMVLELDDGAYDRETKEVRLVSLAEAGDLMSSPRDLRILRRLIQLRTRIVPVSSPDRQTGSPRRYRMSRL